MKHINPISRASLLDGGTGNLSPAESLVILLLTVFFSSWDNFPTVIQNLRKFYSKT